MPLASTGDILATDSGTGAFNVIQLEHATAIVKGAERSGHPVILQLSENAVRYHGAFAPIATAMLAIARDAAVPTAVHLDHATDRALVEQAVELGFTSVMYDASTLPYEENVAATASVTALCHDQGIWVEAELGEVGGKDGVHAPGARTDPAEAAAYVAATGVDGLAVAVGTSHAMATRTAALDYDLIAALRAALPVPLVLHGSSGVSDEDMRRAVAHGMAKINIATHLNGLFTAAVRERLAVDPVLTDTRRYLGPGRDAVADEVTRLLTLLAQPTSVHAYRG